MTLYSLAGRFQSDADLNRAIGRGLVRPEPAIDWRPAQKFIPDATDPAVRQLAAGDGRVLVSRDAKTMPHHFAAFAVGRFVAGCHPDPGERGCQADGGAP